MSNLFVRVFIAYIYWHILSDPVRSGGLYRLDGVLEPVFHFEN